MDIILVQTQLVLLHDHSLGGTYCNTWKETGLTTQKNVEQKVWVNKRQDVVSESIDDSSVKTKKHSHPRTILLPELSRLDAAAPSEHALAACVVRPSRSWIHMV
jgi:hypothetical protein